MMMVLGDSTPNTYLLDTYGGAELAFSLRRLSSSYSGDVARVSNGTTTDEIGFTSDYIDETSLYAHVGGNSGSFERWYEQSGNNNTLLQTTLASQPYIIATGTPQTVNGKLALIFTNLFMSLTSQITLNSSYAMFFVCKRTALANRFVTLAGSQTAPVSAFGIFPDSGLTDKPLHIKSNAYALANSAVTNIDQMVFSVEVTSSTIDIYIDGTLVTSTYVGGSYPNTFDYLGRYSSLLGDGIFQEGVLYNFSQASNHSAIVNEMKTYYSIP